MMSTATFPPLCSAAIICGDKLVSQVYPAAVPVETFIDSAVELLDEELRRRGWSGLDPSLRYVFQKTNGTAIDITKSLSDCGVEDGATLVLMPAADTGPFEPQIECLSTGLARIGQCLFPPVTARVAISTAVAILAMTTVTVTMLSLWVRCRSGESGAGAVAVAAGLILAAGAIGAHRWMPEWHELSDGFAWSAIAPIAVGLAIATPGHLGASHGFIGCLMTSTATAIVTTVRRRYIALGSALVAWFGLAAVLCGLRALTDLSPQRLGIVGLLALLFLLTAAPNIALRVARIRPPYFGSVTGREIFKPAGGQADAVAPVDAGGVEAGAVDSTPPSSAVRGAAIRANAVLTGVCSSVAIGTPQAALAVLRGGSSYGIAPWLLVWMFVLILISRARAFSDRRQAVPLVLGAAGVACVSGAISVSHAQGSAVNALVWTATGLMAFGIGAVVTGLLVPVTRFTPLVRSVTEWTELVAIVVAVPLAAWLSGLFSWVRAL